MPTLNGDPTANVINGGIDPDVISGHGGADTLNGGGGDDLLYGYAAGGDGAITSTAAFTGLDGPVAGSSAPGDPGFLYFVERTTGIVARVNETTGSSTDFLAIPTTQFSDDGERGVLGLAFHPDYATNGRFFVFLTDPQGDLQVREFHRSAGNPNVADATSTLVIEIPHQQNNNHNGGWIGFSPVDGNLYISTGDGGGGGDPDNNAQNLNVLLGKILRIDINGDDFPTEANRNYAIPAGNPFAATAGADEIWAYGLRNPFRIAFDPRNGDLYIGDVGQSTREEIDYHAAGDANGTNYGWRIMEGTLPFNPGGPGTPQPGDPSLELPIFDYGRGVGTTITGGEVYVGSNAAFVGQYMFADFGSGRLFSLSVANGAAVDAVERNAQIVGAMPSSVVDFVTGTDGALYAIGIGGAVWRLAPGAGAEDVGDTLNGGAGNDQLFGQAGNDILHGDADNDILNGGFGADQLDGGAGSDTASYANAVAGITANLANAAVNTGEAAGDAYTSIENLFGSAFADTLRGNTGANILSGGNGNDTLVGDNGDDTLIGGGGADNLQGGGGVDTVSYAGSTARVLVRLWNQTASGGHATGDTLSGIENAIGSANGDLLIGSDAVGNTLDGGDGGDYLDGLTGNDRLLGGEGDDTVHGGAGADLLQGGNGFDTVDYANSTARVLVRLWNQTASGGDGNGDTLGGFENAIGSANADLLIGADSVANVLDGGAGNDFLDGLSGDDTIVGGAGADTLAGGMGADTVGYVGSSARVLVRLWNQTATGGDGNGDALSGFENATGSSLNDLLIGSDGVANVLNGGAGSDYLDGLSGNDTLIGGAGADTLHGGAGADAFVFNALLGVGNVDALTDFSAVDDTIQLSRSVFDVAAGTLAASAFVIGAAAADGDDRIIYNSATGALYYDPDGNGGGAMVQVATLTAGLPLTNDDFFGINP